MKINRRNKRIFWEHKATYIGMFLLIVLSVSCYFGFKTSAVGTLKNVEDNRKCSNVEDANFGYTKELSDQQIAIYENDFDLELQKNRQYESTYKKALLRIRPPFEKINKSSVYEGRFLENDKEINDKNIMVDRFFLKANKLSIGDAIPINRTDYTICGTFIVPDYLSLLKSNTSFMAEGLKFGLCLVSDKDFENIANGKETIRYSVVFHQNNVDDFRKELQQSGKVIGWESQDGNSRITTFDGEINAITMLSKLAPAFVLFISSVIMAVVLNRMMKKEQVYVGTLTALGYKKRTILSHYLRLPIIVSILGGMVGLLIGFWLTQPFSLIYGIEYNVPKPDYPWYWYDILLGLLFPALLNVIAALFAVLKALRTNIVALLKANAGKMKKGVLTKLIPHRKGSFKLRFKLKEITSNLPRSGLMLFGIIAASMFVMAGFLFQSAVNFLFENNLHKTFGYEYQYVLTKAKAENNTKGEPYMVSEFDYTVNGKQLDFSVNGVAKDSKFIKLYDDKGNQLDNTKTIATKSVAKRLGLKKGDTIVVKNNSNLKEYKITIDEVCDILYSGNIYMPLEQLNEMLDLPKGTHIGYYANEALPIPKDEVSTRLTKEDSKAGLEASVAAFKAFLYILAFIAAIIGVVVVYIVTVMLVEENRKNISMLKVVGYHNKEISRLLLNSTSSLVWIGFFIAIPITFTVIQAFFDSLTKNMYICFEVNLPIWQIAVCLIFILAIYYGTLFLAKKKVLKVNMAESLKARE